ncbi:MAG: gliding motility protein GldN, partial [Bacteroidia bacterium]|nr:gliding motility protein GldN [Bacteroidia bacterium]
MKNLAKIIAVLCVLFASEYALAQNVLDGAYVKENTPKRRVIPYTFLREADVAWSKRIWRVIDLREKINQVFYFPVVPTNERKALIDIIHNALVDGRLTAYGNPLFDDEFKVPLTKSEVEGIFTKWDSTNTVEDPETGEMKVAPIKKDIGAEQTKQFLLKEDWFFDKQRSVLDVRIIGICPQIEKYSEAGEFVGFQRLFWIYFPEARPIFANAEVYNRKSDEERRTYEDVFWKRQFNSYIFKESNVFDRSIPEYKKGLDALLESEDIKATIFNWEHDL